MSYTKEIFVKDYFEIHNFYEKIYGKEKTIILMQVGSFHEAYCTDNKGLNLIQLAQDLDVICTKKNGNKELSDSNPRMMGFPIHTTPVYIDKLINLNFTVVLIDQTTEPPNPKREITGIYSPATYLNKINNKSNNIVSIVIDKTKSKFKDELFFIGLSSYDLTTGMGYIHETVSTINDQLLALDDALRFLETVPPCEILLVNKLDSEINNMNINTIQEYLQLNNKIIYNINVKDQQKVKYQEILLNQVFPPKNQLSVFENLGIERLNLARLALTVLIEYVMAHQTNLLKNISYPQLFNNDKYLYLGNRALEQLNVFSSSNHMDDDIQSLFNIIDFTKTSLGKRFLIDSLTKPLITSEEIVKRYESINIILDNKYISEFEKMLLEVYDIEKLNRRINIGNLQPSELYQLYLSFYQITKITNFIKDNNIEIFKWNDKMIEKITEFTNYIKKTFILSNLNETNFSNYNDTEKTFFNNTIIKDIDILVEKIKTASQFIDLLKTELEKLLQDDKSLLSKADQSLITSKFNERDGHYLLITNRRCKILKEKMEKGNHKIKIGDYIIQYKDLEFNELPKSSSTKINCDKIKLISNEMVINKQKLAQLNKQYFKDELKMLSNNYSDFLIYWAYEIGYLDFINSGAKCAIENKYSKPIIKNHKNSFFTAQELRHPIIEAINKNYKYIPQNIGLGGDNELDGILLYGINSSGKSTLMKSIGLNIILAQIGYYVSAKSFIYNPYKSLFTRIIGNDNIYKGLSSFMVEMLELTAILKRNNNNTLVIGDEICRGTEEKSANIIVAYMLKTLSESNSSFITATHFHKVATLETVKNLTRVKPKHLKITYDSKNEQLIYDRILSDGQGESFYGLQVAKYLMKDSLFNDITNDILQKYEENDQIKKSNYNNDYMIKCEICQTKKNLESHHIVPQKDFDENKSHKDDISIKKDMSYNLVTLCSLCHDKIDTNEIIINGWIETSNGRQLDYYLQEKEKIQKHSDELIKYIMKLKKLGDSKMARLKIIEKFNRKVSTKSIESYWNV